MRRMTMAVAVAGTMAMLAGFVPDADAASVRIRCEKRTTRSKISVDGNDLPAGTYQARVTSGANTAVSGPEGAVKDEAEFDFDSDRGNIAAGATAIPAGFINGSVVGEILNASGGVVASATVACRVRR